MFGDGAGKAEALAAALEMYPLVPNDTSDIHFLFELTFLSSGLARIVFEAEPCVKRFQCDGIPWKRATPTDAAASSPPLSPSRPPAFQAISLDPSSCTQLMADPILRMDLDRGGGRFILPCVDVAADPNDVSNGLTHSSTAISARNICKNLPLLTQDEGGGTSLPLGTKPGLFRLVRQKKAGN